MSARSPDTSAHPKLEMASVLFADILGYSKLPMDQGARLVGELTRIVEATAAFQHAKRKEQLVMLPTGDGMALAFFGDPVAPVKCAADISRSLRGGSEIHLRMGVHIGPVYQTVDINQARNVAGGGINLAQRVMDCGDEGHILLSQSVADMLGQLSEWREYVQDIGEMEVKHGERVHIFSLHGDGFGNAEAPRKAKLQPEVEPQKKSSATAKIVAAAVLAVALLAGALNWERLHCRFSPDAEGCVAGLPLSSSRTFDYWITMQQYHDGEPIEEPRRRPGEVVFQAGYRIFLHIGSPQDGHFYIVTEGPDEATGLITYVIQFPFTGMNDGEAFLKTPDDLQIPESGGFVFDEAEGTEKFWLVWAAEKVPELEAVKGLANPQDWGVITDPEQVQAIKDRIAARTEVTRLKKEDHTLVATSGEILIHLVPMTHF